MSEEQKTIDALWPIALAIGRHIKEHHTAHGQAMHFGGAWDGSSRIAAAFAGPGVIEYRLNNGADIRLTNIDVAGVKPEDITIGPITPTGPQKTVSSRVMSTRNETLDDIQRELKYRDLQAQEMASKVASEVGVGMSVGLRQQIGYGSEIAQIQGETELTVNIEASFKQAWENQVTSRREVEIESVRQIVERAMHELLIERVEQIGPARQEITAKGRLTFGIRVHSNSHWWVSWDSLATFLSDLQGVAPESGITDNHGATGPAWGGFYRHHPVPRAKLAQFQAPQYLSHTRVREFEENTNVDVRVKSVPLNDKARLQEALKLVSMQAQSDELREMAKKELG